MTDPEQRGGGGLAAFGRHLVQERELRGLTRDDVVRATRLPASAIEAIEAGEAGDSGRTPNRAYVVGYLRGYAAAIGIDPDELVLRYDEAIGPESNQPAPRSGRAATTVVLLLLGVVAAAAIAWWSLRGR